MTSVFVAGQSSCFFLSSREQIRQVENRLEGHFLLQYSFACAGEVADFNFVKNQSRGHTKKVKCISTSKRVRASGPRAQKQTENAQIRQL